ncbi:MAG: DUF998 domain-containing protein [Rubrobacteraceae bacterium]|nr:DUF998 domain-containing protein [Rubrobacteraceae bacterium]
MRVQQVDGGAAYGLERRGVISALAVAGIAGPIVFVLVVVVQSLLHPDYSQVKLPISALAAWPGGWVQSANFVVFGMLTIANAIGLHLGVRPSRARIVGPALLVLSGVGLMISGAFSWKAVDGDFVVPAGHLLGALLSFLGTGIGFIVVSRRMAADPRWRGVAMYALASGIAIVALFVMTFALVIPLGAPLHSWGGLVQRVTLAVWFPCMVVLALRLLRVARTAKEPR